MSDITKKVGREIPPNERTQVFDSSEVSAGDVIMVESSLGRTARVVTIQADDTMSLRFNVYHTIAPPRYGNDLCYTEGMPNLALAQTVKSDSQDPVVLEADETFVVDDIPVRDIEVVTCSGTFEIFVA